MVSTDSKCARAQGVIAVPLLFPNEHAPIGPRPPKARQDRCHRAGGGGWLDADDLDTARIPRGSARDQSAAADGHEERVDVGRLFVKREDACRGERCVEGSRRSAEAPTSRPSVPHTSP
jgi:hypothetical protein